MGYQTVRTVNVDGQIYQTMVLTANATVSGAVQVPFQPMTAGPDGNPNPSQHVFLSAETDNIIFKFGPDSTTAASATVSSSLLPAGNIVVLEGATLATDLNPVTQSWVSVISQDASAGKAYIMLTNTNI